MNSIDHFMSFDAETKQSKSAGRSQSGRSEMGNPSHQGDREEGLNFSQMLVDHEERAEKAMSNNHQRKTEKLADTGAIQDSQPQTSVNASEGEKASDTKLANNLLPAIVAQGLAVQAQIVNESVAGEAAAAALNNAAPAEPIEQAVQAVLATINETTTKGASPMVSSKSNTAMPGLGNPSAPASEMATPKAGSGPAMAHSASVENSSNLNAAAATAINEIEEVIQGLIDEDADLSLPESDQKLNKQAPTKSQPAAIPSVPVEAVNVGKSVVSESQLVDEMGDATTIETDASHKDGEQNSDQQSAEQQQALAQAQATANNESSDSSGAIALDSVEVAAPAQDASVRTHMASSDRVNMDANVGRQIRAQVTHHVTSRVPNVMTQEKLTINLNPEKLGQVEVTFLPKGDRLMVMILATDRVAEAALINDVNELTDRIIERSGRFNQVEIKVELKDGAESRHDSKQNDKNDERQGQKRGQQERKDSPNSQDGFVNAESLETRQAWQSALDWQLNEELKLETVSEEK
ncbi:MAG: hypothetical protein ACI9UK_000146 [Candidatus Krumholzibacteriia bacterium]|jgi:hypothetical protein